MNHMTDITTLLDELQDLVDDKRERVCVLFNRLREVALDVPRPMTLVFTLRPYSDALLCKTAYGMYVYEHAYGGGFVGSFNMEGSHNPRHFNAKSQTEMVDSMQSHFNAAWSAMTAKGAAT
jgi:hypothetical protein